MSLDALRALKDKLKKEKEDLIGKDHKFIKKAELDAAKLDKIRKEEEEDRKKKDEQERKRKLERGIEEGRESKQVKTRHEEHEQQVAQMHRDEVIRRLRALGHPATLFGEDDHARLLRFLKAEKEVAVEDDTVGGQQENVLLGLQKRARDKQQQRAQAQATKLANLQEDSTKDKTLTGPSAPAAPMNGEAKHENETQAAFALAAAMLAEKRAEESMTIEQKCEKRIKRWVQEWEEDLERRPQAMKQSGIGHTTTLQFRQTAKYLEPLYERLRHKALHEELRAGLWMMVEAIQNRNYLQANDIYLRLAIGNAPWPIGVTSVGIHERSAREKISHAMNRHGQAHIMNDEATRKFLQAMKRLLSAVQRMYPTDPSRSADFETTTDLGRGVAGSGSHKLALQEAEARGETWTSMGLAPAPHFLDKDGKVMVPPKWNHLLKQAKEQLDSSSRESSPAPQLALPMTALPAGGDPRRSPTPSTTRDRRTPV